jgi:hypothetical protein
MEYLTEMVRCRSNPSPFEVLFDREIIRNWEKALENCFLKSPTCKNSRFKIQKYVQIRCKIDGTLNCTPHYGWNSSSPFRYWTGNFTQESLQETKANIEGVPYNPVNPMKVADVKALFGYLEESSIDFIKNCLRKAAPVFVAFLSPKVIMKILWHR